MQRRMNIQASSSIIFISILAVLVQFAAYYYFEAIYVIWGLSCLIAVICCHILLEQLNTYEACFNFSLLTMFISLVVIVITYFGDVQVFLPYSDAMLGIALINWLIPMLLCYIRHMLDYGTKVDGFTGFYRNSSILFLIFYLVVLGYASFDRSSFSWAYPVASDSYNILPFNIIASLIEDYLYSNVLLGTILTYLLSRILIFLPYGFYITLIFRRRSRLLRFAALFLLPLLIELLQLIFIPANSDIDDLIYALIGGILGSLFFGITNLIFRAFTGKNFLMKEADYRFSNSNLHF